MDELSIFISSPSLDLILYHLHKAIAPEVLLTLSLSLILQWFVAFQKAKVHKQICYIYSIKILWKGNNLYI